MLFQHPVLTPEDLDAINAHAASNGKTAVPIGPPILGRGPSRSPQTLPVNYNSLYPRGYPYPVTTKFQPPVTTFSLPPVASPRVHPASPVAPPQTGGMADLRSLYSGAIKLPGFLEHSANNIVRGFVGGLRHFVAKNGDAIAAVASGQTNPAYTGNGGYVRGAYAQDDAEKAPVLRMAGGIRPFIPGTVVDLNNAQQAYSNGNRHGAIKILGRMPGNYLREVQQHPVYAGLNSLWFLDGVGGVLGKTGGIVGGLADSADAVGNSGRAAALYRVAGALNTGAKAAKYLPHGGPVGPIVGKVAGAIAAKTVGPVVGSALRTIDRSSPALGYAVRRTSGVGAADALTQVKANSVRPRLVDINPDLRYPVKSLVQRPAPPPRVESPPVEMKPIVKEAPAKVGASSVSETLQPAETLQTPAIERIVEPSQPPSISTSRPTPQATFGTSTTTGYAATFFKAHPELAGKVWVHHAVPQHARDLYDVFSESELHSIENLRGVPKEINSKVHLSQIGSEWKEFYTEHPTATREQLLEKATEIDRKYGHHFTPPR